MTISIDPFARHQELKNTRNTYYNESLGEASNITDNSEQEAQKISQFIPTQASTEEGVTKLMQMMRAEATGEIAPGVPDQGAKPTPQSVFSNPYTAPAPRIVSDADGGEYIDAAPGMKNPLPENVELTESTPADKAIGDSTPEGPEFKDEEVLPILDALLTTGCAKYTTSIRGIPLTLRTQYFWEDQMVVQMADRKAGPETNLRITGAVYYDMYALAANLETFGGAHFPSVTQGSPEDLKKSFMDRVNYLQTLPSAVITIISMKRLEFLRKVNFVITNFDRLIEVF